MKDVAEAYVTDAYHSLSIEGYRVSTDLIERVRRGTWNPDGNEQDREQRDAMAARGYFQAHEAVQQSISKVLGRQNSGEVAREGHRMWYRELFAPSVAAGLLRPADLAGYRNGPVYIRQSMHVPLNRDAVLDAMPAFFDLVRDETDPAVRVVLGHFVFVYIHPYMDGNGRMGRFVMNLMMAAGGYPWTVIPVSERKAYMAALEKGSVGEDIGRSRNSWRASLKNASPENRCRKCRRLPRDQVRSEVQPALRTLTDWMAAPRLSSQLRASGGFCARGGPFAVGRFVVKRRTTGSSAASLACHRSDDRPAPQARPIMPRCRSSTRARTPDAAW
jgi:fido (protein-threonine AMPylation protein)